PRRVHIPPQAGSSYPSRTVAPIAGVTGEKDFNDACRFGAVSFDATVRGEDPQQTGEEQMKHMLIMRATQEAVDASKDMDFEAIINAMGAYNESMIKAGVLVGGDGLAPEPGSVVDFSGETP